MSETRFSTKVTPPLAMEEGGQEKHEEQVTPAATSRSQADLASDVHHLRWELQSLLAKVDGFAKNVRQLKREVRRSARERGVRTARPLVFSEASETESGEDGEEIGRESEEKDREEEEEEEEEKDDDEEDEEEREEEEEEEEEEDDERVGRPKNKERRMEGEKNTAAAAARQKNVRRRICGALPSSDSGSM